MHSSSPVKYEYSAGGIVYRKNGGNYEWLLIRHSKAGHWGFPKGHIADTIKDETPSEAAIREVREEGGITAQIVSTYQITTKYYFSSRDFLHKKNVQYFVMEYVSGSPDDHDAEVSDATFFPTDEVVAKLTYKSDKEAFRKALKLIG